MDGRKSVVMMQVSGCALRDNFLPKRLIKSDKRSRPTLIMSVLSSFLPSLVKLWGLWLFVMYVFSTFLHTIRSQI